MTRYFKSAFSHIPGYRSGEKTNQIVASIYYLAFILFFIISILMGASTAIALKVSISGILLPFIIFVVMDRASKNF